MGADRLDYSAYTAGAIAIDLETFSATAIGGNFTGIEAFSGSALEDTLSAGSGNDVIIVNAVDSGTINAIYSFAGIENVSGGAGDDQFVFGEDGNLSGTNGAAGDSGKDTLDYSGTSSARNIHLTGVDADGYAGYELNNSQNFSGMDVLLATSSDSDRLNGIADGAATWILDGDDSTYQSDSNTQLLGFTGFELLYGSSADDTFIISGAETARIYAGAGHDDFVILDGAILDGTLDGGGGSNTLDYSDYSTSVTVDLSTYEATGITSIVGIQNVIGGSAADVLIGDNGDNLLSGRGGDDDLRGGLATTFTSSSMVSAAT